MYGSLLLILALSTPVDRLPTLPESDTQDWTRSLPEGSIVVDYRGEVETADLRAQLFFPTGKRIDLDLGPKRTIESACDAFRSHLVGSFAIPAPVNDALLSLLWEPIQKHVDTARVIFVSPDSILANLPLEALQLPDGSYLIEHHAFSYLDEAFSTARALRNSSRKIARTVTPPDRDLLVVGGIDYYHWDAQSWLRRARLVSRHDTTADRWAPRPASLQEALAILGLHQTTFRNARQRMLLQGSSATEERLKTELPRHRIIHIATHGFYLPPEDRSSNSGEELSEEQRRITRLLPGLLSGLVCAGANRAVEAEKEDGLLTAEELSWLDFSKADLVVLSGSETGLGLPTSGEGLHGLRRALRLAGARTVVSSLWPVKEEPTNELMHGFYERLWVRGEDKITAFRETKLDLVRKQRAQGGKPLHPSVWGAFIMEGAWN